LSSGRAASIRHSPINRTSRRRPSCKIDVPRVNCVNLLALGTKSQGVLALHGK
jgi:hypothetical protein